MLGPKKWSQRGRGCHCGEEEGFRVHRVRCVGQRAYAKALWVSLKEKVAPWEGAGEGPSPEMTGVLGRKSTKFSFQDSPLVATGEWVGGVHHI